VERTDCGENGVVGLCMTMISFGSPYGRSVPAVWSVEIPGSCTCCSRYQKAVFLFNV